MISEETELTASLSPGERLKEKRTELGISLEEVSNALLISVSNLKALEDNRYEELPGLTYIIGYWRSYANILEVDISDEIEIHKDRLQVSDTQAAYHLGQQADVQHKKSRRVSVILFVLLFAGFLGGLWYWQKPAGNRAVPLNGNVQLNENNVLDEIVTTSPVLLLPKSEQSEPEPEVEPEPAFEPEVAEQPVSVVSEPEPEPAVAEESVSVEPEPEPEVAEGYGSVEPEPAPAVAEEPVSVAQEPELESNPEPESAVSEQSTPVQPEQTALPVEEPETDRVADVQDLQEPDQGNEPDSGAAGEIFESDSRYDANSLEWLKVDVSKTVWIDIRNGRGEKLVFRTVSAGENLEVNGEPPFYVYIDSLDGVNVFYLGEAVDIPPHSSGQSSRFVVGKYPE